jgi:uncharacterized repeat protein (TIGR03837 family)
MTPSPPQPALLWDIFCQVIDNHGDLGVCWRLSCQLAARGQRVRLWVDDASALSWMAPGGCPGVEVKAWTAVLEVQGLAPGDVWVEAFGCEIAPEFIASYASAIRSGGKTHTWINLEYLSAQAYVERNHGLTSPVMSGPGAGMRKHFFYPGFTARTGGLLREADLLDRQARFDRDAWLSVHDISVSTNERLVSLFCYEPSALPDLLAQLAHDDTPNRLLVTAGRATSAVRTAIERKNELDTSWNSREKLSISYLPYFSQDDFDQLLWACDLNFVRGEDSVVRALWACKPFIWHIYPQFDDAHHDKLNAFLNMLQAPPSLRLFHQRWNGIHAPQDLSELPPMELSNWGETCRLAHQRLLQQDDLVSQLLGFDGSRGV